MKLLSARAAKHALLLTWVSIAVTAMAAEATECPAPPICPVCPACPGAATAEPPPPRAKPLQAAEWSDIKAWPGEEHAAVWPALQQSCSTLSFRQEWQAVCWAAASMGSKPSAREVRGFFELHFTPWRATNPDGSHDGLVTGYFEPVISGSRERSKRFRWPIHGAPADMLTVDLAEAQPDIKHMRLRGRLEGNRIVPYWTRGEIDQLKEALPAPVLLWAEDPLDLFFMHVQGSGQVRLPDGSHARIGYADQNGHTYASIGRWLIDRGEMALDQASMQGIREWARNNPERLGELLNANPSYVFFRELPPSPDGPIGALGVPLTAGRSIATDPRFVPLGAPVFLDTTHPLSDRPLRRLMMAQDTGSAIKGPVRADFYWGTGSKAGEQAGRMRQQGRMWVLLPMGMTPP